MEPKISFGLCAERSRLLASVFVLEASKLNSIFSEA